MEGAFAAYRDGGLEAALQCFAPDAVWYFDADEWVEDLAYRGHDGLRAAHAAWVENLDDFGFDVHGLRDLGGRVLVRADITGLVKNSVTAARLSMTLLADVRGTTSPRSAPSPSSSGRSRRRRGRPSSSRRPGRAPAQ